MIITRKIEIFICEDDKNLRKSYITKLYDIRKAARKAANIVSSHLFVLNNTLSYLSEEDKEKLVFLGVKGEKATKRNAPYVALSEEFKGKADMGMLSNVMQNASKCYQNDIKELYAGKRSLRSYRSNIPIPFQRKAFVNLRASDYVNKNGEKRNGIFFVLSRIPFQMKFGRDRSGNRIIVDRVLSGEYKMCTSSIQIDDERNKTYLLLCVDIPKKEVKLEKGKTLYAYLGIFGVINCITGIDINIDSTKKAKITEIGSVADFNYKRRQIQEAVRRCQISCKNNNGGKGRKRKMQALDRFHEKENNYIDTQLHRYSRQLVNIAIDNRCDTIYLLKQTEREEKLRGIKEKKYKDCTDEEKKLFGVLRNWSYYGLKTKIEYKSKLHGITLKQDKDSDEEDEE